MNPTGAPEPFWDFYEVMKGLFILVLREHPVGVSSWVTVEQDRASTQASGMAKGSGKMESLTQVSGTAEGLGEAESPTQVSGTAEHD